MIRFLLCLFVIMTVGCSRDIPENCTPKTINTVIVSKNHPAIKNMVRKARQIALIKWETLDSVPTLASYYLPKSTVYGIPYSSVKEKDKFIGHNVSFYTFMTATRNPYSVLYTENVSKEPYNGTNCGPYYGTVCSMAVNYALGIDLPYGSISYEMLPTFANVEPNSPSSISEGDIIWRPGHVFLILDIERESNDSIINVTILESLGTTFIKKYNKDEFVSRWNNENLKALRYLDIKNNTSYTPIPYVINEGDPVMEEYYNDKICVSRGDKASFEKNEEIVINILSDRYKYLELYRDEKLIDTYELNSSHYESHTFSLQYLNFGNYKARLSNDMSDVSDFTHFEIIDANVTLSYYSEEEIKVSFHSFYGFPKYVMIVTKDGGKRVIDAISTEERLSGSKLIRPLRDGEYVKVLFEGMYGNVSNTPTSVVY